MPSDRFSRCAVWVAVLAAAALLVPAGPLRAEDRFVVEPDPDEPEREMPGPKDRPADAPAWRYGMTARWGGETTLEADFRDFDGSAQVNRSRQGVALRAASPGRLFVDLDFDTEFSVYDFDDAGLFQFVDDAHRLAMSPRVTIVQSDRWTWGIGGSVGLSKVEGADVGESVTASIQGFASWEWTDALSVQFGFFSALAPLQLDSGSLPIFPFVGFRWTGTRAYGEGWGIKDLQAGVADDGLFVSFSPADKWWIRFNATFDNRVFRLQDDGPVPDGIYVEERIPIGMKVTYAPSKHFAVDLRGAFQPWNNYEILDDDGSGSFVDERTDVTGSFGVNVRLSF